MQCPVPIVDIYYIITKNRYMKSFEKFFESKLLFSFVFELRKNL